MTFANDPVRSPSKDRDPSTGALVVLQHSHHEVHEGVAFVLSQRTAVNAFDIAAPLTFYITTPAGDEGLHLVISGEANVPAFWELFEDNGNAAHFDVAGGSAAVPLNRNRNSATVPLVTVTTGATVTQATADALIDTSAMGRAGGSERNEFILKPSTEYLIRATSYVDNNEGSITLGFYQHESGGG